MKRASIAVLAAFVALAAIVAGCGGDDSDTSASLTKAQFVKQADAICKKGNDKIEAEFESFVKENELGENEAPSKALQEEAIAEIVAPSVQEQVEEIDALGAPEGDEEQIEEMLTAFEEGAEELEENPSSLNEGENPIAKGSKLARDYGLVTCGEE